MNRFDGVHVEPADQEGIHIVQRDGGFRIYVKIIDIPGLILELEKVVEE